MMPDWERHYVLCVVIGFLLFLSFVLFAGSLAMNYLVVNVVVIVGCDLILRNDATLSNPGDHV